MYSGAAELTNLSSSTTGLVVNTGGVSTIANISLENLSCVNTGALIKCKYLTYDGTSKMLSDGTTDIKPYNGIYSGMSLTGGNVYSVMGIYIQFGNTKEICPRTAADITTHTTENLTIGETGYATYYNSASAYAIPYDCEGYVFTAANGLELAYDPGEEVPAGEALVLYTIAPGTKKLPITTCSEQTYASAGMNDLLGTDTETELTADADSYFYALQTDAQGANVGFYWMNNTGAAFTNGAHKAYLKLPKTAGAPSRILFNENDVTNIQNVEASERAVKFIENGKLYIQKDGVVYDAMGKTVR